MDRTSNCDFKFSKFHLPRDLAITMKWPTSFKAELSGHWPARNGTEMRGREGLMTEKNDGGNGNVPIDLLVNSTVRASYLESCLPSCHSVCPAAWASVLLTVKKTSVEKTVIINDLPLHTYCVKLACAGVSHCWRVSPHAILWASGRRIGAEQMFPTRRVQKTSYVTTPLPARPSFGCQDNLMCSNMKCVHAVLSKDFTVEPLDLRLSANFY
jgi:hypothetical protein